jgi:hypothetical protein
MLTEDKFICDLNYELLRLKPIVEGGIFRNIYTNYDRFYFLWYFLCDFYELATGWLGLILALDDEQLGLDNI